MAELPPQGGFSRAALGKPRPVGATAEEEEEVGAVYAWQGSAYVDATQLWAGEDERGSGAGGKGVADEKCRAELEHLLREFLGGEALFAGGMSDEAVRDMVRRRMDGITGEVTRRLFEHGGHVGATVEC